MARKKKETSTDIRSLIATRRDGGIHSRADLDLLAKAAANGEGGAEAGEEGAVASVGSRCREGGCCCCRCCWEEEEEL